MIIVDYWFFKKDFMSFKDTMRAAAQSGADIFAESVQETINNHNIERFAPLCMMNLLEAGVDKRKAIMLMAKRWSLDRNYLINLADRIEKIELPTQLLGEYMEKEGYVPEEIFRIFNAIDLPSYLQNRATPKKFSAEQLYKELKKKYKF